QLAGVIYKTGETVGLPDLPGSTENEYVIDINASVTGGAADTVVDHLVIDGLPKDAILTGPDDLTIIRNPDGSWTVSAHEPARLLDVSLSVTVPKGSEQPSSIHVKAYDSASDVIEKHANLDHVAPTPDDTDTDTPD